MIESPLARTPCIRRLLLCAAFSIAFVSPVVCAQTTPTAPAPAVTSPISYDVVSIRQNKSAGGGSSARSTPDGDYEVNTTLWSVIGGAYGVHPDRISGLPRWAEDARYDITRKVAADDIPAYRKMRGAQGRAMDQAVLADRFKLQAHIVPKEFPIYELVVAKDGPKLHEAKPGDTYENGLKMPDGTPIQGSGASMGPGTFTGQQVMVGSLLNSLRGATARQVVDKTDLTGKYDITLHWTPDQPSGPTDAAPPESGVSIFTALEEQLGLKLQPAKGVEDTLVVDHIEPPTEN